MNLNSLQEKSDQDTDISGIKTLSSDHPFESDTQIKYFHEGLTIKQIVGNIVSHKVPCYYKVWINGEPVPTKMWDRIRPREGTEVVIKGIPRGGGSGNTGKQVASTVVSVAAIALGQVYLAPALAGLSFIGQTTAGILGPAIGGLVGGAASSAIMGGAGGVNSLSPGGEQQSEGRSGVSPRITGNSNKANRFGAIPCVLGKHRMYPTLAAKTFTETEGEKQFYRMLLTCGFGPVDISDIRIGETPIDEFEEVEKEVREGYDDDKETQLYSNQVDQNDFNIKLDDQEWQTRTTEDNIDEITVDATFRRGLVQFDKRGNRTEYTVTIRAEYRKAGTNNSWTLIEEKKVTKAEQKRFSVSFRQKVNSEQYEVRLKKLESSQDDPNIMEEVYWTALRSITYEDPISIDKNISLIALRIKATNQLQGRLDSVNCLVQSKGKRWDKSSGTWEDDKKINGCAEIFRHILQHQSNPKSVSDERLDLKRIENWADNCKSDDRTYNSIIDFTGTLFPIMKEITAAGRASYNRRDGMFSVVQDTKKNTPVQYISARNSWDFKSEKTFPDLPDAWRIKFINENEEYEEDSRLVVANDVDESNISEVDELEFSGVTDPDQVWQLAIHKIAGIKNRTEVYTVNMDPEYMSCHRGDLVRLTHDVMLVGLGSGRILRVDKNDSGEVTGVRVDEKFNRSPDEEYNARIRLWNGEGVLKDIDSDPDDPQELNFDTSTSKDIQEENLVQFGKAGEESIKAKVTKIVPDDDMNAKISMVDAAPGIHDVSEPPIPEFESDIENTPATNPPIIDDVRSGSDVVLSDDGKRFRQQIRVSISLPANATLDQIDRFEVEWKNESEEVYHRKEVRPDKGHFFLSEDVFSGILYNIRIRTVGTFGGQSRWKSINHTATGDEGSPPFVPNFSKSFSGGPTVLLWEEFDEEVEDLAFYEVRFTPNTDGKWEDGVVIDKRIPRDTTSKTVKTQEGVYMIKARDFGERKSTDEARVEINLSRLTGSQYDSIREGPDFSGTKDDVVATSDDTLELETNDGVVEPDGTYTFDNSFVLDEISEIELIAVIKGTSSNLTNEIRDWGEIKDVETIGGGSPEQWDATIEFRFSETGPNEADDFTGWRRLERDQISARKVEFRLQLTSNKDVVLPAINTLGVDLLAQKRTESSTEQSSSSGVKSISFDDPFIQLNGLSITINDAKQGDYVNVTNKTNTGFDIEILDSGDNNVSRSFDYMAKGIGKEV